MRNFILSIALTVILTGCGTTLPSPTPSVTIPTGSATPSASLSSSASILPATGLRLYSNPTYHFSLDIPDETFSLSCEGSRPVEVRETEGKIEIGNRWSCEGTDPAYLRGWTIYASNGIETGEDADAFVKKAIGPGCTVTGWDGTEGVFISPVAESETDPEVSMKSCPFIWQGKYRLFYSERWKTLVFWSLTQEPQFVMEDKRFDYDDAILESFKFN